MDIHSLPALNAILNTLAFILLLCGYISIKRKKKKQHRSFMVSALIVSALFLTSYLTYHYQFGHKVFPELGWIKTIYLIILIPHIILAAAMVPFILLTFYFALTERWIWHRRVARVVFPVWVFVSITGIIIYLFLKSFYF